MLPEERSAVLRQSLGARGSARHETGSRESTRRALAEYQVEGLPTDAALRPTISNGWFVDSGGQLAYQPVTNTYGAPVAALGM